MQIITEYSSLLPFAGAIKHWPALSKWRNLQYLTRLAGNRTVPVEVGEHYLQEGWGQKLMLLSDFIKKLTPKGDEVLLLKYSLRAKFYPVFTPYFHADII